MRRILFLAVATVVLATGIASCQQLFTTSLGKALARDSLPIPSTLSASEAATLAEQAKGDVKLASALVSSLVDQLGAAPDPATKSSLMGSAASAAIDASGTSAALMGTLQDYINTNAAPTPAALTSLLATIQAGASGNGVVSALSYLDPSAGGMTQAQAEAAGLGATDLAIAAVVIVASVLPPGTVLDSTTTFDFATLPQADQKKVDSAKAILAEAQAMAGSDPSSADLLNMLAGNFSLPKTP